MFRPTKRPSSGLQSSERLNIVCVWRMLRSHHLANNGRAKGHDPVQDTAHQRTPTALPAHTQFMSRI